MGLAETLVAAVRFVQILPWPDGDNPGRVDGFVATEVVGADMVEVDGFRNARHLVDIAQEAVQVQVIADAVLIALEVGHIDRIEADKRRPQANIGFGQLITGQVAMLAEDLFQTIQRAKDLINGFIIGCLVAKPAL